MNEKRIKEIYEDYLENIDELATEEVKQTYRAMKNAIDDYSAAASEFEWTRGFKHALRLMGKEVQ